MQDPQNVEFTNTRLALQRTQIATKASRFKQYFEKLLRKKHRRIHRHTSA